MAEASTPGDAAAGGKPERIVYAVGGGRRTFFSFLFLLLLPFFMSLPAMLWMRVSNGFVVGSLGFIIMAVAFSILMLLILIELIFSLRTRIELREDKVVMTLPAGRGPTPMIRYRHHEIPYENVQTVETRREVYGGSLVPVLLKGARLITKDGTSVPLGYVSEANVDPALPYPEIAREIALRARLPLIDRGSVWRSVRRKFLGWPVGGLVSTDTVDETQIARLNHSHNNVVLALCGSLVLLMAIGIVSDLVADKPVPIGGPAPAKSAALKDPAEKSAAAKKTQP